MGNKMVFWFVVRVIGITTLLIGLYVLYTGIDVYKRQDQEHAQRRDVAHADAEEAVGRHAVAGGELALVPDCLRPELPADHNRHQQRAERHQDALGDAVEEVQPVGRPCLRIRDAEDIRRGDPLRAEGIETDERTQRRAAERRDEGIRLSLIHISQG